MFCTGLDSLLSIGIGLRANNWIGTTLVMTLVDGRTVEWVKDRCDVVSGGSGDGAGCSILDQLGVAKWQPKVEGCRSNAVVTGMITSCNIIPHIHFGIHFRPSTQSFMSQRRKNLVSIEFSYNYFHFGFNHPSTVVPHPPKKIIGH